MRSSHFGGTPTPTPGFKKLGLRLRVKVRHRLLNLCDCDSVMSERCRQTNSTNCHVYPRFGLLRTVHYFTIFCKIVKTGTAYAESSFWHDSDSAFLFVVRSSSCCAQDVIQKPMIRTSSKVVKKLASDMFRSIQAYMGDRKSKDSAMEIALDVAVRGWSIVDLRDEIYIQLCRQTTRNPHEYGHVVTLHATALATVT